MSTPSVTRGADAIRALGFDPLAVQTVVHTPRGPIAIASDYPEPYTKPEEAQ